MTPILSLHCKCSSYYQCEAEKTGIQIHANHRTVMTYAPHPPVDLWCVWMGVIAG